jgi:hypothetical protein
MTITMIEEKVRNAIINMLQSRKLTPFWVSRSSQFLDVGGGVFVELVVNEGSKLQEFEEVVAAVKAECKGLEIESIVRAVWVVESVRYIGLASNLGLASNHGIPLSADTLADTFEAILNSGSRKTGVRIDVTWDAFERLKEELRRESRAISDANLVEITKEKVNDFLVLQLSLGGTSYWDPLRYRDRVLNGPTMAYVALHSAAYRQLESAINYTLDQSEDNVLLPDLLRTLSNAAVSIHNAEDALQFLPAEAFGGAYMGGEVLENASGAYQKLSRDEKVLIKTHFQSRVEELEQLQPAIVATFPKAFRN